MLDSRTPVGEREGACPYAEEDARREAETERQVEDLLREVRMWRVANSAQWVAWGIVQAKVPELDDRPALTTTPDEINGDEGTNGNASGSGQPGWLDREMKSPEVREQTDDDIKSEEAVEEEEDEFDYLGYAQSRAMFFWGDVVGLGIVKKEELPECLRENLKIVEY